MSIRYFQTSEKIINHAQTNSANLQYKFPTSKLSQVNLVFATPRFKFKEKINIQSLTQN